MDWLMIGYFGQLEFWLCVVYLFGGEKYVGNFGVYGVGMVGQGIDDLEQWFVCFYLFVWLVQEIYYVGMWGVDVFGVFEG